MTREQTIRWTCDRCGLTIDTGGGWPDDWIGVAYNEAAPAGSWEHHAWVREHWCATCATDLRIMTRAMGYRATEPITGAMPLIPVPSRSNPSDQEAR